MTWSQPLSFVEINSNSSKYYIVLIITLQLCFVHFASLYNHLSIICANWFNLCLCHCRHRTKCRMDGNDRDDTQSRSTCVTRRTRRWRRRRGWSLQQGPAHVVRRRGSCFPRTGATRSMRTGATRTGTTRLRRTRPGATRTGARRHQGRQLPLVRARSTSAGSRAFLQWQS